MKVSNYNLDTMIFEHGHTVFLASSAKFEAVFGTVWPNSPISIVPTGSPPIVMSKNTYRNQGWPCWCNYFLHCGHTFSVTFGPSWDSASWGSREKIRNTTATARKPLTAILSTTWSLPFPEEKVSRLGANPARVATNKQIKSYAQLKRFHFHYSTYTIV